MSIHKSAPTNAQRLAILIPCCLIGAYAMGCLQGFIPAETSFVPVASIALLAAPITLAMSVYSKLADLRKMKSFSRQEKRRLEPMLDKKTTAIHWLFGIYTALAVLVGLGIYVATLETAAQYKTDIFRFAGASIAFSAVSSLMLFGELRRASNFEAHVVARSHERKQKAALLKRLQPDKN